nr:protein FAR1-RELATED SEQUENCE 5-like [Quercus suber]
MAEVVAGIQTPPLELNKIDQDIGAGEKLQDVENLLGMVVHSEEEAYKLYNDYAIRIGFSVRKEKLRYTKNGVRQRDYVCSKEGFPRDSDHLGDKKFKRLQTRTGCEASIRFTVTNDEWKVTHFNSNHNHELAKPKERPFLRSNRKITDAKLGVIRTFKEAGVNHHWKNVLFGCAFLLDETTASFTWLFETFLESMGNQKPKTIFTDQCQAMKNAIRVVLPDTCHRLCLWHISKNAAENLPRHYMNPEFKSRFNKILYNCETEIEFQSCWDTLLRDYNLVGNKWLSTLYENRERWCSVFSHNIFSCRMKASSRSESTNNFFQHMACKTMRLTEFVHEYEKASKNMRTEELEEDFRCKQGTSFQIVQNCGLLQHASSVYTRTMFKRFELEITSTLGVTHQDVNSNGVSSTYEVIERGGRRVCVVHFNSSNNVVTCNYKMFETLGLLCRHALRILIVKNVTELPV